MATNPKPAPETVERKEMPRRILRSHFQVESPGFLHTIWSADLVGRNTLEDVTTPDFWSLVSANVKRGDLINVRSEKHDLFVQLYVAAADRNGATVRLIAKTAIEPFVAPAAPAKV